MEPLNEGQFGYNIKSAHLLFVERVFLFGRFKKYRRNCILEPYVSLVLCREVYYTVPLAYLGESTIRGFTIRNFSIIYFTYSSVHSHAVFSDVLQRRIHERWQGFCAEHVNPYPNVRPWRLPNHKALTSSGSVQSHVHCEVHLPRDGTGQLWTRCKVFVSRLSSS